MDVVNQWSGGHAAALQAAMRATNEELAHRLGVAVRTVASWHAVPSTVPRREIQRALDTLLEQVTQAERQRFSALLRPESSTQAQALKVAIAIVVRNSDVLLVCRRGDEPLSWGFPAGVVKPGGSSSAVAVQETLAETAVHCTVRQHLGTRIHPTTGVLASYEFCEYLAGELRNADPLENLDTAWVSIDSLTKFIPTDRIFPPILTALEAHA